MTLLGAKTKDVNDFDDIEAISVSRLFPVALHACIYDAFIVTFDDNRTRVDMCSRKEI